MCTPNTPGNTGPQSPQVTEPLWTDTDVKSVKKKKKKKKAQLAIGEPSLQNPRSEGKATTTKPEEKKVFFFGGNFHVPSFGAPFLKNGGDIKTGTGASSGLGPKTGIG